MELRPAVLFLLWTCLSILFTELTGHKLYTNTWAVHIPEGPAVADELCRKHGFINHGQVSDLWNEVSFIVNLMNIKGI